MKLKESEIKKIIKEEIERMNKSPEEILRIDIMEVFHKHLITDKKLLQTIVEVLMEAKNG